MIPPLGGIFFEKNQKTLSSNLTSHPTILMIIIDTLLSKFTRLKAFAARTPAKAFYFLYTCLPEAQFCLIIILRIIYDNIYNILYIGRASSYEHNGSP